ncbi:MAG: TSUP family transporter [Dechloromonas sp.]|uniref:Probable membrane transporter protein n=1 Tax=Candidatus Dechloromonas phosphorivorans TaxID=2899244 RepID=A0A935K5Y2_9RHOO|nr:TSUP family transporter [Candidatus Dechloromonas phosphorivorans]
MLELLEPGLFALILAAFIAGAVDAVVGGGGLIQIPALFAVHPGESAATLFGTNKCASVVGTANATWRYARRVTMPWRTILPAALAAFTLSYLGAAAVAWLPKNAIRPMILVLLILAAVYTLKRKDFGLEHRPAHAGHRELFFALLLGGVIGFYDGFFGPGTGSFLIFLFVRFFGFDFLHASAGAKVVNVATNLAALAYFVPNGYVLPFLALAMALANVSGSMAGTWLALKRGSEFIRQVFLVVVGVLIVKFAWDTLALFH